MADSCQGLRVGRDIVPSRSAALPEDRNASLIVRRALVHRPSATPKGAFENARGRLEVRPDTRGRLKLFRPFDSQRLLGALYAKNSLNETILGAVLQGW